MALAPTAANAKLRDITIEKNGPSMLIRAALGRNTAWVASIFNDLGEKVATREGRGNIINEVWDGTDSDGQTVRDGTYIVQVRAKKTDKVPSAEVVAPIQRLDAPVYWYSDPRFLNKGFAFDHLIILDWNDRKTFPGGEPSARGYGKFIQHELRANPTSFSVPPGATFDPEILMIDTSQLYLGCPMITHINNMFKLRLVLVYVDVHGDAGFFGLGPFTWYANDPGTDGHGGGPVGDPNRGSRDYNFNIRDFTDQAGYDIEPPKLVWIDSCESAGTYDSSGVLTDWSFASAFGITFADFETGVFVGWSGDASGYGGYPPPDDEWTAWRRNLWDRLFAGKKNFITSLNQTNSITQKSGLPAFNGNPLLHCEYSVRWRGNQSMSF